MLCVFGCLLTEEGKKIKEEMLKWLEKEYDVLCIDQKPPGKLFEYPAIKYTCKLSIETNEPVLYIHTKGAANKIPEDYEHRMMSPSIDYPKSATPEDCQKIVRNMWRHEFTGDRAQLYKDAIDVPKPTVSCPHTGREKFTWNNAWMINTSAAKILDDSLKQYNDRFVYETLFSKTPDIDVIGIIKNDCDGKEPFHKSLWDSIWKFYESDK